MSARSRLRREGDGFLVIDTSAGLMQAHGEILRAVAGGRLPLQAAKDISTILDSHRRVIETVDLEERITKLEQAQRK
jgi:hypothetical protein